MHMISKRSMLVTLAAGIAAVGIGLPAASASTAAPVTQVIKVKAVSDTKSVIQTHNSYTFIAALWQGNKAVGQVTVTCYFTTQSSPGDCGFAANFYRSGFIFGHVVNTKTGAAGTVNGGTRSFDNAHGTILVVGPGNVSWITLRFTTAH
jgi:hypothetical protein